jgi:hypothetical protein
MYFTSTIRGAGYRDLGVVALHASSAGPTGEASAVVDADAEADVRIGANHTLPRVKCLTCGDVRRTWNTFSFSGAAFVRASDGVGFAPEQTVGTVACGPGGRGCTLRTVRVLEDNEHLVSALKAKRIALRRFAAFSNAAGQSIEYQYQCPEGATAATPVLVDVYGGPRFAGRGAAV